MRFLRTHYRQEDETPRVRNPRSGTFVPTEEFMRAPIVKALLIPLFLVALGGCAGITGTEPVADSPRQRAMAMRVEAIQRARISLQAATAAGCEITAPFEYYMAQEYFQLAEHELAGGDKDGVVGFAEKSKTHATRAIEMAKGEKR